MAVLMLLGTIFFFSPCDRLRVWKLWCFTWPEIKLRLRCIFAKKAQGLSFKYQSLKSAVWKVLGSSLQPITGVWRVRNVLVNHTQNQTCLLIFCNSTEIQKYIHGKYERNKCMGGGGSAHAKPAGWESESVWQALLLDTPTVWAIWAILKSPCLACGYSSCSNGACRETPTGKLAGCGSDTSAEDLSLASDLVSSAGYRLY